MNAPERVMAALRHEEPDKVPTFESTFTNDTIMRALGIKPGHFGPLARIARFLPFQQRVLSWAMASRGMVAKSYAGLYKFYAVAGIDLVPSITALFPRKLVKGGFIDEFGRCMHFEYYKDGTEIIGYTGGHFSTMADYDSWEQPDPAWEGRLNAFLAGRDVQATLGDRVFSIPGTIGLMEVTWECFGMESFARLLAKKKDARKVFDDRGKFVLELVKILAEREAGCILVFDDYGFKNGLLMSPRHYRELVFPWLARACDAAHRHGCKVMLHSDGDLTSILDDLVRDCKIDALNPIEPSTANPAYDIFGIHERYGDVLTLAGNVPPTMLATGTIEEIQAYTKRLLVNLAPGGGFILASGHSINPAVTLDRWQAMMQARDAWGSLPVDARA